MQGLVLIPAGNPSTRVATVSFFIASSGSSSRVFFPPGNTMPSKYQNEQPIVHETGYGFSYRLRHVLQYPPISSRDTTIRKRQSLSTCRLSFSNISLTNSEILPQRKHAM